MSGLHYKLADDQGGGPGRFWAWPIVATMTLEWEYSWDFYDEERDETPGSEGTTKTTITGSGSGSCTWTAIREEKIPFDAAAAGMTANQVRVFRSLNGGGGSRPSGPGHKYSLWTGGAECGTYSASTFVEFVPDVGDPVTLQDDSVTDAAVTATVIGDGTIPLRLDSSAEATLNFSLAGVGGGIFTFPVSELFTAQDFSNTTPPVTGITANYSLTATLTVTPWWA